MQSKELTGSLLAIFSGFLYGFLGYFGVSVMKTPMPISTMLFWRFFIAAIGMLLILPFTRKERKNYHRTDLLMVFLNGAFFYTLSTMLYFYACPYIGSGLAMVIFFTYPALVICLNRAIFATPISKIYYLAIGIVFAGMPLFIDKAEIRLDLTGISFALISALFYAVYIISSKKSNFINPKLSTLVICLGCSASFFTISLINGEFVIPTQIKTWVLLLGIGLISTVIPILLLLYSLNYINTTKASILSVLEPVFVLIFGMTLLGEPFRLQYILGASIVLFGALLALFTQQQEQHR